VDNLFLAPNTLTQRMMGPRCTASVELDLTHMKDGDHAGFATFNGHSGVLTVCRQGGKWSLAMSEQTVFLTDREKAVERVEETVKETVRLKHKRIWLRIDGDFTAGRDVATFYYSTDGATWQRIGTDYKMQFDYRRFFMGSKYAIFCYATKQLGGYVDINRFDFKQQ